MINCKDFSFDIISEEKDWNDPFVTRYMFSLKDPIPSIVSFCEVGNISKSGLSRLGYYEEVLKRTTSDIQFRVNEFRAVMPPEKLKQMWTKWSLGLNTTYLIQLLNDLIGEKPKNPPLAFLKKLKLTEATEEELGIDKLGDKSKKELSTIIQNVWKSLISAVQIIDELYSLNNRDRIKNAIEIRGDPAVDSFRAVLCPKPVIIHENV